MLWYIFKECKPLALTIFQPSSSLKRIIIMQQKTGSGGINLSDGIQIQTLINQLI